MGVQRVQDRGDPARSPLMEARGYPSLSAFSYRPQARQNNDEWISIALLNIVKNYYYIVMMQTYLELLNQAKEILQRNTITVTVDGKPYERIIPSRDYYVHQWLWDTAGVAMGLVHVREEAAFNELLSLTAGQWNNGLMPHIIYNPG